MLVKDLMTKNVIYISPEETVSDAISRMKKHSVHQLLVNENGICGMLTLKNIVTRGSELNTKASSLMVNVPSIDANKKAEEAAAFLLRTGLKAVPVYDKGKVVGIISETDLINIIKTDKKASDVFSSAISVSTEDNVGTVKNIMVKNNVSRVPVVENSRVVGIVGTMELLKMLEADKKSDFRMSRLGGHDSKEKIRSDEIKTEVVMRRPVIVSRSTRISEIVKLLQSTEEVVIENGTMGIITPKDIIELIASVPEKEVSIQIANLGDEDEADVEKMHKTAQSFISKTKMVDPEFLIIHLDRHNKGGKTQYDIRTRFSTHLGLFVSKAEGWGLETTFQESLNRLETEVKKKYGKLTGAFKKKHVGRKPAR